MAGVVLENVSRTYPGGIVAVNGVSLEVQDREFLVLVGPSGCGKTTTLRLIAGLEDVSGGKVVIGNRVVNDVSPKDRDIAMVFQNYALYPHLNVYRNLAFGLELREKINRVSRMGHWMLAHLARPAKRQAEWANRQLAIAERIRQTARGLGIEELLERYPRQLSGGERQRVALGRAIVRDPAVFLFDEPLSNLDAKLRAQMRRELKQLHGRLQATMVYVTHDQVEALTLGERIVVMNEGVVQQIGRPMDVYDWPKNRFVAGFIGMPAMNFIRGELQSEGPRFVRDDWQVPLSQRSFEPAGRNREVILGVRPEDVRLVATGQSNSKTAADRTGADMTMAGKVSLVEMLGDSTQVTVKLETVKLETAKLETRTLARRASQHAGMQSLDGDDLEEHEHKAIYVVSKVDARSPLRLGERVGLLVDSSRVHLFDPQTGENWVHGPAA